MLIPPVFFTVSFLLQLSCNPPAPKDPKPELAVQNPKHELIEVRKLPKELKECSGMALLDRNTFVAVNDGGDHPYLYVFDQKDSPVRPVKVVGVENIDWEELTTDEDFLYISDTGNNGGTRQNLSIYKIRKNDVLKLNEVVPEKIQISYEGQSKFNDSNRHNFDCEAMVSVRDSLFLFSKNRGDHRTDVYGIPKIPGAYQAKKLGSFDAKGLITGADYNANSSSAQLILIGYDNEGHGYNPFLIHFTNFQGTHFFNGSSDRIGIGPKLQAESVLFQNDHNVYISNESTKEAKGFVYQMAL